MEDPINTPLQVAADYACKVWLKRQARKGALQSALRAMGAHTQSYDDDFKVILRLYGKATIKEADAFRAYQFSQTDAEADLRDAGDADAVAGLMKNIHEAVIGKIE